MLLFLLCLVPSQVNAQAVPVGIAVGGDNLTRLVWNNPDSSVSLWQLDSSGSVSALNTYGPHPGWSAAAVSIGPDNFARILCTHPADGAMSLWRVNPSSPGTFSSANYGPYAGWSALSVGVGGNNAPRILWNHTADSQMSLWNVAPDTTFTQGAYGPYTGYTAFRVAAGPNSVPRTLWNKSDGSISLWNSTGDAANYAHSEYGPYPGYAPVALAVDSTNAPRIVWSHPSDSTISLWKVAADGTPTFQNFTNPAGYFPVALAAGTGGDVRLLWSNGRGGALVWTIVAGGTYTSKPYAVPSAFSLSPASITSGGTSTGTVVLSSPAPANGAVVSLTSSNTSAATVPASVTVAAGQTSATFSVTGKTVSATTPVTITAAYNGISQTAGLSVTVPPLALTTIVVSPASATVNVNGTQQFKAVGKDQNGTVLSPQPTFTWSVLPPPGVPMPQFGSISASGLYQAPSVATSDAVQASSGGVSASVTVTVTDTNTNAAPTVATPASANPSPVTGTTTTLSALGADDGGAANLTYTWATTGTLPAAVTFSANNTNAAQATTATFTKIGSYNFVVTIKDAGGLTVTSTVPVSVNATLTGITVSPATATVATGGAQPFMASANDQFGVALSTQPTFTWSLVSGVGSVSPTGLYNAGPTAGSATVKAVSGSVSGTAAVTVTTVSASVSLSNFNLERQGIVAGTSGTGTVTFNGTSSTPITVYCESDTPELSVPASLVLPANQSSFLFNYTADNVAFPTTATVTISYSGQMLTAQVAIQPAIQLNAAATGNDATGKGKISLFWTSVTGATGYNIYRQFTSGGAFNRIASNVTTKDTSPVLVDTYVYTDTGLTNGMSYTYYVAAVMSDGIEKGTSDTDADVPDPSAIPWDTGNAASIVAAARIEAASSLVPDPQDPDATPELVGTLMIASPDGVIYVGNLPDGTPAQVFPSAGYYDATTGSVNYSDGTASVASAVSPHSNSASSEYQSTQSLQTPNVLSPHFAVGETALPSLPPTGITRQIQSQPGFAGMVATVGLPNSMDPTTVRLANNGSGTGPKPGKIYTYNSVGDIYTGGHIYFPASIGSKYKSLYTRDTGNIDAGLQLTMAPVANTAWQPIMAGTQHQSVILGGSRGKLVPNLYKVFVTGQVLMEFETPTISPVKAKHLLMHYGRPYTSDSNLYGTFGITLRRQNGVDAQGNPTYDKTLNETSVTLFYTGGSAKQWLKSPYNSANPALGNNQFVIKRTNSIAQTINPIGQTIYKNAPTANGPGNGFYMDGSYLLGAAWGDGDPYGSILLYPGSGYASWTDNNTITSLAGFSPLDARFVKSNLHNPYFWETNLNMRTSLGTLAGF